MESPATTHTVATLALTVGAVMVVAVPAATGFLAAWAHMYGTVLVYLAFVEYVAVAVGLVRWGVGQLRS